MIGRAVSARLHIGERRDVLCDLGALTSRVYAFLVVAFREPEERNAVTAT